MDLESASLDQSNFSRLRQRVVETDIARRFFDEGVAPGCALLAEVPPAEAVCPEWQSFANLVELLGQPAVTWPAVFEATCPWYEAELPRFHEDAC
jgi:hypothetical protein